MTLEFTTSYSALIWRKPNAFSPAETSINSTNIHLVSVASAFCLSHARFAFPIEAAGERQSCQRFQNCSTACQVFNVLMKHQGKKTNVILRIIKGTA